MANGKGRVPDRQPRAHVLLVAIILAVVCSLLLGMAFQPLRSSAQRLKEEELIYRGEHLAQGIRRYYFKYRRFPAKLEDLIESEPRLVRRLYEDPMSPDGAWVLITLNQRDLARNRGLTGRLDQLLRGSQTDREPGDEERQDDSPFAELRGQQITGVRSASEQTGFRVRSGSRTYADWIFSALPDEEEMTQRLPGQASGS
jgi:hypothetical protein